MGPRREVYGALAGRLIAQRRGHAVGDEDEYNLSGQKDLVAGEFANFKRDGGRPAF